MTGVHAFIGRHSIGCNRKHRYVSNSGRVISFLCPIKPCVKMCRVPTQWRVYSPIAVISVHLTPE